MFLKKLLMGSMGIMLVGTTIVETRAGVKSNEAVDVFAGERTLNIIAEGGVDGRHSGSQVIGGITPGTVGEAGVSGEDGRGNNGGKSDAGYHSGLIAVTTPPPKQNPPKQNPPKQTPPKPKGK
jgi:hypothetical protein